MAIFVVILWFLPRAQTLIFMHSPKRPSNRHWTAKGGSVAFSLSDHVTKKTLMDVEREDTERHQIQKRGRPTSKVWGCFNMSLEVSPLAGEDGGLGEPSGHGSGRQGAGVCRAHRLRLVIDSHFTPPALSQLSPWCSSLFFSFYWSAVPELGSLPGMPEKKCKGTPTGIIPISNGA